MALNPTTVGTTPAEFADRLSEQLLLQPDAEFIFAKWAYSALVAAQMKGEDGFDLAMLEMREGRPTAGGAAANLAQAMSSGMGGPLLLSMGMTYPDMVTMVQEAKGPGEVIKINRPKFVDGATTEANRKLGATDKIFGTNSQPITMEQVDVKIEMYGGPGDATGNIVPLAIGRFAQNRAAHDLLMDMGFQLRRDRWKFVDDLIMTRFISAAGVVSTGTSYGGGVSGTSSFTGAGNEPVSLDVLIGAVESMKGRKIPGVGGAGKYVYVADIHQVAQLKLDPQYQRLSVFQPEYNPLFPGYMATCENLIICESNRMQRLSNIGGPGNLTGYQGLLIAPGAMGWGSAEDARAIRSKDDDGGRFGQFAWEAYEGWKVLDDRFVQLIITD